MSYGRAALAAEVRGVLLSKVGPLLRQVVLREDGRDWAGRNAGAAVDALDRIDEELLGLAEAVFILFGVDAIDRTCVHTGGVLGADTGFCNDICHSDFSGKLNCSTLIVAQIPSG